ncbi:hypothetical protein SRB5_13570 [Streptomyces sp. RB5]|uniref:Uncharacterized protein n=1 Tax=Streptomyces smaragdinus TaxID=2585196 RepID=A0A7K0CDT9_9ACTN|nr:hypothetical protein [Streptomyces smaragdinus]MQY11242.1 hypothetical protein [Streptomyces smaragdinus]
MTTTAGVETAAGDATAARRTGFSVAADGSYAACLATDRAENWYPERWTLDGPEPYAVPLPCRRPEEPGSSVLPLPDGRVLIRRMADGRHELTLLYPSGPATGEQECGSVEAGELRLVPPPRGRCEVYALAPGAEATVLWLVRPGSEPSAVAELPGRCTGGQWLDAGGGLLAVDRELAGRTKTVAVDLGRGGEVSPLLQITEESNDRLLLADPDSGLLLVRSDAPELGDRLGWGVLGGTRPVRFTLRMPGVRVTPIAVQPGQVLTPERCGVALRLDGPAGSWLGVWRPGDRELRHLPPPLGWVTGAGLWSAGGELRLPYATADQLCGLARITLPDPGHRPAATPDAPPERPASPEPAPAEGAARAPGPWQRVPRPVPLREAPLGTTGT